jgi:hypothetical protein
MLLECSESVYILGMHTVKSTLMAAHHATEHHSHEPHRSPRDTLRRHDGTDLPAAVADASGGDAADGNDYSEAYEAPVKVNVIMWVNQVQSVDSVAQTFKLDVDIEYQWYDPRVIKVVRPCERRPHPLLAIMFTEDGPPPPLPVLVGHIPARSPTPSRR